MSIHKFGYKADSLQKDKIENLEKELESQTKLINMKHNDMQSAFGGISDKLEKSYTQSASGNLENIQEIIFDDGETKVVVNAKSFLDINKDTAKLASQIEDIKINFNYSEQDIKTKLLEKKTFFWMLLT